jgi:hypothetical protein
MFQKKRGQEKKGLHAKKSSRAFSEKDPMLLGPNFFADLFFARKFFELPAFFSCTFYKCHRTGIKISDYFFIFSLLFCYFFLLCIHNLNRRA